MATWAVVVVVRDGEDGACVTRGGGDVVVGLLSSDDLAFVSEATTSLQRAERLSAKQFSLVLHADFSALWACDRLVISEGMVEEMWLLLLLLLLLMVVVVVVESSSPEGDVTRAMAKAAFSLSWWCSSRTSVKGQFETNKLYCHHHHHHHRPPPRERHRSETEKGTERGKKKKGERASDRDR